MRTPWLALLVLSACGGETSTSAPAAPPAPAEAPPARGPAAAPVTPSIEAIRARSGCAFESIDALCAAFREHYASAGAWVSDGCALGPARTSGGDFAEAREVGIRVGYDDVAGVPRVPAPVLLGGSAGGSVGVPAGMQGTTQVVLAARVGSAWFPIVLFHPIVEGEIPGERVEWALGAEGARLTWTVESGASMRGQGSGYGETERSIAVVDRGVPVIAAQGTIERWRADLDVPCLRECNQSTPTPPAGECDARCRSRLVATRTWAESGDTVRIGATELRREGLHTDGPAGIPVEDARTRSIAPSEDALLFCAFVPVVRAVATAPPSDPEAIAARERGREIVRGGTFRELPGAADAATDGPRATIEILEQTGGACGGGACTFGLRYRTIEGTMPEQGVHYFAAERGPQVGCDPESLPEAGATTFVEVAPAREGAAIGCGFGGYDGTQRLQWVITRVLVR